MVSSLWGSVGLGPHQSWNCSELLSRGVCRAFGFRDSELDSLEAVSKSSSLCMLLLAARFSGARVYLHLFRCGRALPANILLPPCMVHSVPLNL